MRKTLIFVIVSMLILLGCTDQNADIDSMNKRIDEVQQANDAKFNEIITRLDDLEISIIELEESINETSDKVETEDYEEMKDLVSGLNGDIKFIEHMIWGSRLFDRSNVQVGDSIGEMKIVDISGQNNQIIQFSGEEYVVGTFSIFEDNFIIADGVAFYVDKLSSYLPRERNDQRDLWFMFSNSEEAKAILSEYKDQDEIVIIIDDYLLDLTESEVVNEARLVRVISEK